MIALQRWDIVSVAFPFVEGYDVKRRPGLIVSTDALHKAHQLAYVAMITTARNLQDLRPQDILIKDAKATGLPENCVIRPSRITAVELGKDMRILGSLSAQERRAVLAVLKLWFAV
jgi:mRNA-degrading endonuclease toxin of MazEF toxin-antitoxin module